MTELISRIEHIPTIQELCEMELWSPTQGSLKEAVPISIDLDFSSEQVALPGITFKASAAKATIYVKLQDATVARGSRLGEYPHDPEMFAEVTQSIRTAIESGVDTSGTIEVGVEKGFFGKLTGIVKWTKKKSKKSEHDHIVKTSTRIARIAPRPKLKWDITEPVKPNLLKGRYIGTSGEKEVGPLFLLTMRKKSCVAEVNVAISRHDIIIQELNVPGDHISSKNKRTVLEQLARRCINGNQLTTAGPSVLLDQDSVILCSGKIGIEIEDQ